MSAKALVHLVVSFHIIVLCFPSVCFVTIMGVAGFTSSSNSTDKMCGAPSRIGLMWISTGTMSMMKWGGGGEASVRGRESDGEGEGYGEDGKVVGGRV